MADAWTQVAQILYVLCAGGASLCALALSLAHLGEVRALLTPRVLRLGSVVVGIQVFVSIVALLLFAAGTLSKSATVIFLLNWMSIAMAAVTLPAALWLERQSHVPLAARRRVVVLGTVGTLLIAGSVLAMNLVLGETFTIGPAMEELLSEPSARVLMVLLALVAAPVEEVLYRGGVQGLVLRYLPVWTPLGEASSAWIAVVFASLIWALGHAGMIEPHGVKETQIFLTGLIFGWLRLRGGLRAAITAHLGLNGFLVLIEVTGWIVTGDITWNDL